MKVGDLVVYRDWQEGDRPLEETPEIERGWGDFGIVYWVGLDGLGCRLPEPAVDYLNQHGQLVRAFQRDLSVVCEELTDEQLEDVWGGMSPQMFNEWRVEKLNESR